MIKDAIVRFDTTVTALIQHWPNWLQGPMLITTTIGQPLVLGLVAALVGFVAWQNSQWRIVYSLLTAEVAMAANMLLKHYIHRPRPDTLYVSDMFFKTSSFPSGHAFGAMVICGLLGYLAIKYLPAPWNLLVPIGLSVFILAVGISRVYLGAHFPTDVLAGWILGLVIVVLIVIGIKP